MIIYVAMNNSISVFIVINIIKNSLVFVRFGLG